MRPINNSRIWLKYAPFKQRIGLNRAPSNISLSDLLFFKQFCREFSFAAIARFLGGTFGQNSVMGDTKTF